MARTATFSLLLLAIFLTATFSDSLALRQHSPSAAEQLALQTQAPSGRIVVKFSEDSPLSMGDDNALAGESSAAGRRVLALLARLAPNGEISRRFRRPAAAIDAERGAAEIRSGLALPDLNRYAQIDRVSTTGGRDELLAIVRALLADPAIENAFLEPVAVLAALGFDAFAPAGSRAPRQAPIPDGERSPQVTPDFVDLQGYLNAAPEGIDAFAVAGNPGADGATMQVIDVEGAWLWAHEDLPNPFFELGGQFDDLGWRNHGTAVMGEIRGHDNGLGVRGITPAASVGASSIAEQSVADALNNAAAALSPGDVILIELHAPGPNSDGNGQFGYVCMEFWQDNFDAILLASAAGLIVCEAAGNGQQDFDTPVYLGLFDRDVRDSGAILIGATNGSILAPAWFTNHGERVDLNGWGSFVVTCGYGTLQGDSFPETEWYSNSFSGTSSASPIIVGAVASLNGMVKAAYGFPLDARLARDILNSTGTFITDQSRLIGTRPDLAAAWAVASTGIGRISGVVTDAGTGDPVAGALVEVQETAAFTHSAADGGYSFPLVAGAYHLSFSSFYYITEVLPASVSGGVTTPLDIAMDPKPSVLVEGFVWDQAMAPLAGARVSAPGLPIAETTSAADGSWALGPLPWADGESHEFLFDGLPGYGVGLVSRTMINVGLPGWIGYGGPIFVVLPDADEDFEADAGGFTSGGVWSWGTPAAGGPTGGFSGSKCWGVGMSGDYGDNQSDYLESPSYDFSGESVLLLSFHYWRDTEAGFDGVNLQVWTGSQWRLLQPLTGYTDIMLGGLGYASGWSGTGSGWEGALFDLTGYISANVRFRFEFGSDGGVTGPGFWIDDLTLANELVVTAVPGEAAVPAGAPASLDAYPNPFNPSVTIAWSLPRPGPLSLAIYDVTGRRVRDLLELELAAGAGEAVWDGRDEAGSPLASGIYLARMESGGRRLASRRIVLIK